MSGPSWPSLQGLKNLGTNGLAGLRINNDRIPNSVSLRNGAFADFRNLTSLIFDQTPIDSIGDSAFAELQDKLVELTIRGATLTIYRKAIGQLTKLKRLDLSDNLFQFPMAAFSVYRNLEELRVSGNILQPSIDAGAFNQLSPTLQTLYMDRCGLIRIPKTVLSGSPQVSYLSLADNLFWLVGSGDFPADNSLTYLNLDGNPITTVNIGATKPLAKVKVLSWKRTTVASMGLWLLDGMDQLEDLRMDQNVYWKGYTGAGSAWNAPNLKRVNFSSTSLTGLSTDFSPIMNRPDFEIADFSNNLNLICTEDESMHWIAKYAFCEPIRLLIENSQCVNLGGKPLKDYLLEIVPDPCGLETTTDAFETTTGETTTSVYSTTSKPGFKCECQCQFN